MDMDQKQPRRAPVRPLADLAASLGCTSAAIYSAYHKGHIGGVVSAGRSLKIRHDAFDYHAARGYGANVPPFGTEAARATEAA